jgi:two-component system, LuxR family, sensor kinase FixL
MDSTMNAESGSAPVSIGHSLDAVLLATAVDAIITIDRNGIMVSANAATTRMFGYECRELLGQNVSMLMPSPYREEHPEYIDRYLETGKPSIIGVGRRVSGLRRNGTQFPVHLAVSEFQEHGQRFFAGIIRDLSELDFAQRQLLQSERLAAIGQMVTGLAHESRNALQRAQACLDMLALDLAGQTEQLDLARRARTALQDLYRLYEEVRSYAAPIHLEYRSCELKTIWRKQWENLSSVRGDRSLSLAEYVPDGFPLCEVDVHRMEQVFRNVLENAIQASPDTGVVSIECQVESSGNGRSICVSISDDGPGLTPEASEKIFEPFFTTRQKGTGLGMAIVQRIVLAHGGSMTAGRKSGRGAEISIRLPTSPPDRNAIR